MRKHDRRIELVAELLKSGVNAEYILLDVLHRIPVYELERLKQYHYELSLKAQKASAEVGALYIKTELTAKFKTPA